METNNNVRYKIGIDVGTHSVGFCATKVDDVGFPINILNSVVYVHDSGVDPTAQKRFETRKAISGVKRRTRKMYRQRRRRLAELDKWIEEQNWPLVDLESQDNPYLPWVARKELVTGRIDDPQKRDRYLSIALRHMARHRGWRNPYAKVRSLYLPTPASVQLKALQQKIAEETGYPTYEDDTPAELIALVLNNDLTRKLRGSAKKNKDTDELGPDGIIVEKLMQSDNANELRKIAEIQELPDGMVNDMIDKVFASISPRGSAIGKVGKDTLPGQEGFSRAAKADEAFQKFRIVVTLAKVRVDEKPEEIRNLSSSEMDRAVAYLMSETSAAERPSWRELAEVLGLDREALKGTATRGLDGERPSSFPPVNVTDQKIRAAKIPAVISWWEAADYASRSTFISELSNAGDEPISEEALEGVNSLLESLSDSELERMANLSLPAGRGAYSLDSLQRLTKRMMENQVDLYQARRDEFGVEEDWEPPADDIGMPVGNPAVDRVTKIVARWLGAATKKWGAPLSVNVEHVRSALGSEAMARDLIRQNNARYRKNQQIFEEMQREIGSTGKRGRRSDLTRYLALQRQNCKCAYCEVQIEFSSCEMDHIVPRAGNGGSTNTRNNLVAVCRSCNESKSNLPFAVWAKDPKNSRIDFDSAVSAVHHWIMDPATTSMKEHRKFCGEVIDRMRKTTEDPPIDARSMESVAWMANELHTRIKHHFTKKGYDTTVSVFRGAITAEARKASGFEGRVNLIGGRGKTRLDRRHHAMDAAVISLMRPSVAKTLSERMNLRVSEQYTNVQETWKSYVGADYADRQIYTAWLEQMMTMSELFNIALVEDAIPVMQNLRLRLGNSRAHEEKIRKFDKHDKHILSAEFSAEQIDRASTPALWCALTRLPNYDPKNGLPEDESREIWVNGVEFGPLETVNLFSVKAAAVAVRGGYSKLGGAIHHARVYQISGKKPSYAMLRVYSIDLARHTHEDLFTVDLPPQSISMRGAENKLRNALREGNAEYLGWLVIGDELDLDMSGFTSGIIGDFMKEFPMINRWRLDGFYDVNRLTLRPTVLAAEGLVEGSDAGKKILGKRGWPIVVNTVFSSCNPIIVRRTALGISRESDKGSNLPVCWRVGS